MVDLIENTPLTLMQTEQLRNTGQVLESKRYNLKMRAETRFAKSKRVKNVRALKARLFVEYTQ